MTKIHLTYDRVFIVDDDKVINLAHFQIIKATGVANEIRVFGNPLKALTELSQELESSLKNILVLLDIDMEEINGFEFLDSLLPIKGRELLDIVMVTSSTDSGIRERSMGHPLVRGYFNKPLTKDQIIKHVCDHPRN